MAILDNGLETIELGATAWRVIINDNFTKIYAKNDIDGKFSAIDTRLNSFAKNKFDFAVKDIDINGIIAFANTLPSASLTPSPLGFIKAKVNDKFVKIPYYEL